MNLDKKYYDDNGNPYDILTMVKKNPEWAANQIQDGERAINTLRDKEQLIAEMAHPHE